LIVISKNNEKKICNYIYLPDALFLGGKDEGSLKLLQNKLVAGQTTIYVCQGKTCKFPVTSAADALKQIE